ncbi:MAG: pyridoxamine 5'-phosphate oxidase family protein [Mycobacterium sp.]|nr:pyridoxamine 5'-phosphate oxidase family protein [Mycobacterium sp.]
MSETHLSVPVTVLDDDESWSLLSAVHLGRLVLTVDGRPEIFPVNYVVQRRTVLFRTAEGTKLFGAVTSDEVLFEADDHTVADGWSVIVRGEPAVLFGADEIHDAERAGLYPWIATPKLRFVRIIPKQITGRRFLFGPEPEDGSVPG